jgi:lipid-A-disaccharide synthase-like uncharacterized protein
MRALLLLLLTAGAAWSAEGGVVDRLRTWLFAAEHCPHCGEVISSGLPWYWMVFGFGAQALFMSRMVVQWWASEKAKRSVVPVSFWILSLIGGLTLMVYFLRRGDPVGVAGQAFGLVVYLRNLVFIKRERETARFQRT